MTPSELDRLLAILDEQQSLAEQLRPVEQLPSFGGAYFERGTPEVLVVLTTDPAETAAALPSRNQIQVRRSEFTLAQLRDIASEVIGELGPLGVSAVGVTLANGPHLTLRAGYGSDVLAIKDLAASLTPLSVAIELADPGSDAACGSRNLCYSPTRAGGLIHQGSATGGSCTQGFIVSVGVDEQLLTSGHCGYSGSNSWYNAGYGYLGTETATFYPGSGWDVMRVQIPDSQVSKYVYSRGTVQVSGSASPIENQAVCASLGSSDSLPCGTVTWSVVSWFSSLCGCQMQGAASSITSVSGDSGSPITSGSTSYRAVGVMSRSEGYFAVVSWALQSWGVTIY